jgi:predicted MFS family arabinose efflux permease
VVYGWVFASHQLGAATAAWVTGIARDALGGYGLAFAVGGGIAIAGALLSLGIKRSSLSVATATD